MRSVRQIGAGILLALVSVSVVLGGFLLSVTEAGVVPIPQVENPAKTALATNISTIPVLTQVASQVIDATPIILTASPGETALPTYTLTLIPVSCQTPAGWMPIVVRSSDTLESLGLAYQTSSTEVKQGNCLLSDELVVGSILYMPAKPTATYIPCGAPKGWVNYYVVYGDTLYNIALRFRVTVPELQLANCLGSSTYIQAGKPIKVPFVATSTQLATNTSTPTSSPIPTNTSTLTPSPIPTHTSTPTSSPLPTGTATPAPTETSTPIDTSQSQPSES